MKLAITSRALWGISLPVMAASLHETVIDVANTAFLARYGVTELGAVALGDCIYDLASCAAFGISDGIQIIVARRAGQGRSSDIGKVVNQGLWLVGLVSAVLCLGILHLSPLVTPLLVESRGVRAAVDDFLGIIAYAVFFHSANFALGGFYIGIARPRVLVGAAVILAVTNIALDYVLIFGHLGLPRLGIRGAAIASLVAEIAVFAFLVGVAVASRELRAHRIFRLAPWRPSLVRSLVRVSFPVALEALIEAAHWLAFFAIVQELGEEALGAANIVQECFALLAIPIEGFAEATCTTVSNVIGQGRAGQIGLVLRRATASTYALVLPLAALTVAWPEPMLALFTNDEALRAASTDGLRVLAIAMLAVTPGVLLSATIAGTGDTRVTLLLRLGLALVAVVFTWMVALFLELPLALIWLSEAVGWLVCMGPAHAWLGRGEWQKLRL
jgi:putative MATE family efflux protein